MSDNQVINLENVICLLGNFPALSGVNLDVARGEVLAIYGPNGAGKTTLLRVLAGLVQINHGKATVLGSDIVGERDSLAGRVAILGHSNHLYADLGAEENVRFFAKASRADLNLLETTLEKLQITNRVRQSKVSQLSTGQARRVAIATLMVRSPQLWLLDEPHSGLDAKGRELFDGIIEDLSQQGATILIVSHEVDRIEKLATRRVEMVGGTIISHGGSDVA